MSIDREMVKRLGILSRLRIPEENMDEMVGELTKILGWVDQLKDVDTDGVLPMNSVVEDMKLRERDDVITDGNFKRDFPRNGRRDVIIHFHCLEDEHGLVYRDRIPFFDKQFFDKPREGRKQFFPCPDRGRRRCDRRGCGSSSRSGGRLRSGLIAEHFFHADFIIFSVDGDNKFTHDVFSYPYI